MTKLTTHNKQFSTIDGKNFEVNYFELLGSRPGPTLSIISGQHGSEHSGPILLSKVVEELKNVDFAGVVKICPAANPPALSIDFYYYPEDKDIGKIDDYHYSIFDHHYCPWGLTVDNRYNMSNAWNQNVGGYVGCVTEWLWADMMDSADVIIDMHCLQAEKPLSFIYNPKAAKLAAYFGVEAIHLLGNGEENGNLLYQGCVRKNQYCFCVEYGKQHGIRQREYQLGREGVFNLMKSMGMISGDVVLKNSVYLIGNENHDILAEATGHPYYVKELYEEVKKGEKVLEIIDWDSSLVSAESFSPIDGIVSYIHYPPIYKSGEVTMCVRECETLSEAGVELEKLPKNFFRG